ncbi:cytochrome c-type biogenesis protein CcmH [Sinorhizobium numidicum]|uniref:Cytochrome c-type biogenesis protein n=1 Tax=Sinorhizobium numidicum TaxID=680248 RepID=A0ABY8D2B9_9HYPH|nr:cytochrome c-type biogenesis protein [Sinorhizobium numidicum]WEX78376.1 cytochrome c-type biogenesis protein CcmH [Sinorhizobium numidicum]WEX85035.1 cytochrome c-type biogenesis protein CcmH [Sinorhizobium numidicum]
MIRFLVALFLCIVSVLPALAVNPDEVLADPVLEERARAISAKLRCMVCQNQSIDDSNAELAKDLRVLVRERLRNGDTDEAVIAYVVSRYGEFVLLKPRFHAKTLVLWGMPVILLFLGATALVVATRRRGARPWGVPLSDEEKERLDKVLRS